MNVKHGEFRKIWEEGGSKTFAIAFCSIITNSRIANVLCFNDYLPMTSWCDLISGEYNQSFLHDRLFFFSRYHHITVLIYTWYTYEAYEPPLRWFMTMNMFVHALMYSYYALKVWFSTFFLRFLMVSIIIKVLNQAKSMSIR